MRNRAFFLVAAMLGLTGSSASGLVVNLSQSATSFGLNPNVALNQGTPFGIADRGMYDWNLGAATSPRVFAGGALAPYETWATPQTIRSTRIYGDVGINFNNVKVDVLTGSDPTNNADWTEVYDSGAINQIDLDVDLGATYSTKGLRVRASNGGDIAVGEVEVFSPFNGGGTLTAHRLTATGASSNGASAYGAASVAIDNNFHSRFLSKVGTGTNGDGNMIPPIPGDTIELTINYADVTVSSVGIIWGSQGNYSDVPSSFTLQADTGSGFFDIGTYAPTPINGNASDRMYINFAALAGVDAFRIVVNDADVDTDRGIAIYEFEAFFIPEPASAALLALSLPMLARRRGRSD